MAIPNAQSATFAPQADPDSLDFDIIAAGSNCTGVFSGCSCTPGNSGVNLSVAVAAGVVHVNSKTSTVVAGGTVTPGAANGSNPRFDLVVSNNVGTLSVIAGNAAVSPVYPAASPSTYVVLCAVYIPAAATSITASNITDKRVLVNYIPATSSVTPTQVASANVDGPAANASMRTLGTGSTQAASGDHLHGGTYASTAHALTHAPGGSDEVLTVATHAATHAPDSTDPLSKLSPVRMEPTDGRGYLLQKAQSTTPTSPMTIEKEVMWWLKDIAWRATPVHRSYWRANETPSDALWGIENRFAIYPGTSTTPEKFGAPFTSTGTLSHPAPSVTDGFYMNLAATGANGTTSVAATDTRWAVGDAIWPWTGLWFMAEVCFPDSSYANSGASTGTRIFMGFSDQSVATMVGSDSPVGHRIGFSYVNVNGGLTDTTFKVVTRDGTTQNRTDTSVTLTQNKWYRFWVHIQPAYSSFSSYYCQIDNITDGTVAYAPTPLTANPPGSTTFMRSMVAMQTINAVTRNIKFHKMISEAPVD